MENSRLVTWGATDRRTAGGEQDSGIGGVVGIVEVDPGKKVLNGELSFLKRSLFLQYDCLKYYSPCLSMLGRLSSSYGKPWRW